MEIEIQHEGKAIKTEFDPGKYSLVSQEKADEIQRNSFAKGAEKAEKSEQEKVAELTRERDEARTNLESHKSNLTQKEQDNLKSNEQIATLSKSVEALTAGLEEQKNLTAAEKFNGLLFGAIKDVNFVSGGQDVFIQFAKLQKKNGGFILRDGTEGTIDKLKEEWVVSEVGKALIVTDQRGGSGSQGGGDNSISFSEATKDPTARSKYIEKVGMDKYQQEFRADIEKTRSAQKEKTT